MINIELFCGSSGFTKVSRSFGHECLSVDIRRRKEICEPHLKMDILKVRSSFFESMKPDIMWIGLPCDIWSYASGGFHLDKDFKPKTEKAKIHLDIFYKTIQIIMDSKPKHWFIENPRGRLRNYPDHLEFLKNNAGHTFECTLSSYGFGTTKPTNIFTNYQALKLKELDSFGRGAKNKVPCRFDNMTKVQRQKTPELLYKSIIKQIIEKETNGY
ncbi:DNA cytosine methyltransferase [Mariniflexile gromovii]|uniref:DNA cytosine methyltransferase n=1 Tax=Mariniflexile gromovii TaxID=362523 RepID=A0ABS4BP81_9FLAO|nr:DNA cytosine methyltransferase [Mariniflexile gromovii]MBP0902402.1 DNA cytosine methyltransferase [Mariniflexile gromovii]